MRGRGAGEALLGESPAGPRSSLACARQRVAPQALPRGQEEGRELWSEVKSALELAAVLEPTPNPLRNQ